MASLAASTNRVWRRFRASIYDHFALFVPLVGYVQSAMVDVCTKSFLVIIAFISADPLLLIRYRIPFNMMCSF